MTFSTRSKSQLNELVRMAFRSAIQNDQISEVESHLPFLSPEELDQGLHPAAQYGQEAILERLVSFGAKVDAVDSYGRTPLHWVVIYKQNEMVDQLFRLGSQAITCQDNVGRTPFHSAIEYGNVSILNIFLHLRPREVLALLDQPDKYGFTPLHLAAERDTPFVSEWLLRVGARSLNVPNHKGQTPLHLAAGAGRDSILHRFLRSGYPCDIDAVTNSGCTPFDYTSGQFSTRCLFRAIGASIPIETAKYLEPMSEKKILAIRFEVYLKSDLLTMLLEIL